MNNLAPPPPLRFSDSKSVAWTRWKQRWEIYLVASGLQSKAEPVKVATFLHIIGDQGIDIYNSFKWSDTEDSGNLEHIMRKFEQHCVPKKYLAIERHAFNTRDQQGGETTEEYLHELRKMLLLCEYGEKEDGILLDRIVAGISDNRLRERLLEKCELTFEDAVNIIKAYEASKIHAQKFAHTKPLTDGSQSHHAQIEAIGAVSGYNRSRFQKPTSGNRRFPGPSKDMYRPTLHEQHERGISYQNKSTVYNKCERCGQHHHPRQCPAIGKVCFHCNKINHFSVMCRQKRTERPFQQVRTVQEFEESDTAETEQHLFVGELQQLEEPEHAGEWLETIYVNAVPVLFKLDTGAHCSILPKWILDKVSSKPLRPTKVKLQSYTNDTLQPVGQVHLLTKYKGQELNVLFQVVQGNYSAILGGNDCQNLNLIRRVHEVTLPGDPTKLLIEKYSDVFEGLGRLPGVCHIEVDPAVTPVVHPPRRVPYSIEQKVKQELEKMETLGIIEKVPYNEPSDWVHSLVTVSKPNGEVRVCIDPRDLNRGIKREQHPLRTVEEVAARVAGAKYFSVLDAEKAFYQVELDKESSKLLTFNSILGRYRYLRMPMGIRSAPEIYQRRVERVYEGLLGVDASMDDVLIWGVNEKEHDDRLEKALERTRQHNVKLNKRKCKIKQKAVYYLGHRFTADGLQVDDRKCQAISEMPVPQNVQDLQRFLGMLNYVSKFIPHLSQLTAVLRELLEKETHWHWTLKRTRAFIFLMHSKQSYCK